MSPGFSSGLPRPMKVGPNDQPEDKGGRDRTGGHERQQDGEIGQQVQPCRVGGIPLEACQAGEESDEERPQPEAQER